MPAPSRPTLRLRGAREHNLAGLDLDLPHGRWIAVTGPSGSGKSSLVFDTLVREGERRYLGSLSPRARQFFGKLGRSEVDSVEGLPVTVAMGQRATTPNARSTVGTATGIADLLRLVFARSATPADDTALTRSHFSFNHPLGQCPACRGLGLEDRVAPELLIADPTRSLRAGALVPTLPNGYTVYSQVTLEVMDRICRAHGFDVDTPWQELSDEQRGVILYGSKALKVPFGKHPIESRMKWSGITARPREEGYYRGLVPVIQETLLRNRNANILRFVESARCSACDGTRLDTPGREARCGEFTLPELLAVPARALSVALDRLPKTPVWAAVRPSVEERVQRLIRLGLGHLTLDRASPSLSGGEHQRVRLAAQLGAELTGMLYALDEPTLGLHPGSQAGMAAVLDELVARGNSLVVVEHDPDMVRHADHIVALGPGAGQEGGRLVETDLPGAQGSGPRAADPLGGPPTPKAERRPGAGCLRLTGATLHNLDSADLELSLGTFHVIMGASGAGKSSLVFGTLLPALLGTPGGPYRSLQIEPRPGVAAIRAAASRATIQAVDARPLGRTPRSTPATWCGLFDIVRKLFSRSPGARLLDLGAGHFSFNNARGRCAACDGLGVTRVGLHLFEDLELTCDACEGQRYGEQVLAAHLYGKNIADVLAMTFREAHAYFRSEEFAGDAPAVDRRAAEACVTLCAAMLELGLGHLTLGQSSGSLSRGESQRVKLGTLLGSRRRDASLVLLDEPDRGLAPGDVKALLRALDALVSAGHTVVAVSHHRHVWAAADRLIEVRDGQTDHAPTVDWSRLGTRRPPRGAPTAADTPVLEAIELRGVDTHNLRHLDVDFPRGLLTAVCGVSGSGKSSLVSHTLCAEARSRFAQSLPFTVRRFMRRLPQPALDSAHGLTPTLDLAQTGETVSRRSTVSTLSDCGPILRLLYARAGTRSGKACGLSAAHFSRERAVGACPDCAGRGTLPRCDPQRLVTHADRPLAPISARVAPPGGGDDSALGGTRPGRFFTEADGQHMATLHVALTASGLEAADAAAALHDTPWRDLSPDVQRIVLHGTGPRQHRVTWEFSSRAEGPGHHQFETTWDGLCALVEREAVHRARSKQAAQWNAPLADVPCSVCQGSGLCVAARETTVNGWTLPDLEALPLTRVLGTLRGGNQLPSAALVALLPELQERLDELTALGLGHLALARRATTLSTGELQRVRLASVLRSGLSGVTLVLDEPTAGLAERDVHALLARLGTFRAEGNTVVVVSHRPSLLRAADHLIEIGPGAGAAGGRLLAAGTPDEVLSGDTPTARALRAPANPEPAPAVRPAPGRASPQLSIRGARAHNLAHIDVDLPQAGFVCLTGVSGSGKTSLAFEVLGASVQQRTAICCDAVDIPGGYEHFAAVHDARRAGAGRTALAALGIANDLAALFEGSRLPKRAFVPGNAAGRCPACGGTGRERVAMDFLADLDLPCETCAGQRFAPEVLDVRWQGLTIAEALDQPASEVLGALQGEAKASRSREHLRAALTALDEVAAGHIPLGRPRRELSSGESARLHIATSLLKPESPALHLFDEPSTGLHESDLGRILAAFQRLAERGDLIVATEHRPSALAAADWVIQLGPEGGPEGGHLLSAGPPTPDLGS